MRMALRSFLFLAGERREAGLWSVSAVSARWKEKSNRARPALLFKAKRQTRQEDIQVQNVRRNKFLGWHEVALPHSDKS
jgi:hypothetical protein